MAHVTSRQNRSTQTKEPSTMFFDPTLIKAARKIYRTYCNLHSQLNKKPFGVAIDRETYKGQLVFRERPILLPGECFIHINQIESEIY